MSLICRTCSQAKPRFVNLFNHYESNNSVVEMLNECTSVKIQKGDGLPLHICIECLETLVSAWDFRRMTIDTDIKFRKIFRNRRLPNKLQHTDNDTSIVKVGSNPKHEECNTADIGNECVYISDANCNEVNGENMISFIENDETNLLNFTISSHCSNSDFIPITNINKIIDVNIPSNNLQQLHIQKALNVQQMNHAIENCAIDHNYASNYININSSINNDQNEIKNLDEITVCENKIIPEVLPIQVKENDEKFEISAYSTDENETLKTNIDQSIAMPQSLDICNQAKEKSKPQNSYFFFQAIEDDTQKETAKGQNISKRDNNINGDKPNKLLVLGEFRKLTFEEKNKINVRCKLCNKTFKYRYYYQVHVRHHKGDLPYKCKICGKLFARLSLLTAHAVMHSEARPYACDKCGKTFKKSCNLQKHNSVHAEERPYKCNICDVNFKLESTLKNHIRRHENQRDQVCETCGKTFVLRSDLHIHLKSHLDVKDKVCARCEKAFSTTRKLRDHFKRNHTNDRPHVCEYCGKRFKDKGVMKVHSLIHTGERPHKCKLCNKTFRQTVALRTHMRSHTGEAPYACKLCPSQFKYSQLLTNHMKTHNK